MNDGESLESWCARAEELKAKHVNGNGAGMPIAIAVQQWGTPRSSDGEHGGPNMRDSSGAITALPAQVMKQWPTPDANLVNERESIESWKLRADKDSNRGGMPIAIAVQQWPTPQAHDSQGGDADRVGRFGTEHGGRNLNDEVLQERSSPQARDYRSGTVAQTQDGSSHQSDLNDEVVAWTTPCAHDGHIGYQDRSNGKKGTQLNIHTEAVNCTPGAKENREQLNPQWESNLMGWPCVRKSDGTFWDWTSLEPLPEEFKGLTVEELTPPWPAGQGPFQYPWEPPRTVPKGSCPNRVARVRMAGNGVCPVQSELAYSLLLRGSR